MSAPKKMKWWNEKSRDPEVWLKWYRELSDASSAAEDDEDSEVESVLEQSDHHTSSEEEADQEDEIEVVENVSQEPQPGTSTGEPDLFYIAKDGTMWRKTCPPKTVRRRARNIIVHLPGPKGGAKDRKTEVDLWDLFFDEDIINILVRCTNIYIENIKGQFERERDARPTDVIEMRALIGPVHLIGSLRSSRKNTRGLWDNSKGNGICPDHSKDVCITCFEGNE